jgi:23S rRNA maturation mini-RNase III
LLNHEQLDENTLKEYSAVVLAYIGDAVFELLVRTHVVAAGNRRVKDIHHDTVELVRAQSQARAIRLVSARAPYSITIKAKMTLFTTYWNSIFPS